MSDAHQPCRTLLAPTPYTCSCSNASTAHLKTLSLRLYVANDRTGAVVGISRPLRALMPPESEGPTL
jgi:hypothetical protein